MPELAGTMFVVVFGVFAVGETMYAPVLNPLTASLAPSGMVGTTLGIFAALQTGVSAAGPLLAGVALSAGHGSLFVAVHVGISPPRSPAAFRLRTLCRARERPSRATCRRRSAIWLPIVSHPTCGSRRSHSGPAVEVARWDEGLTCRRWAPTEASTGSPRRDGH